MRNYLTDTPPKANRTKPSEGIEQPLVVARIESRKRREILKKVAIGSTALAGCSILPGKWTSPLVEFGALPAHATTSALITELAQKYEELTGAADPEESEEKSKTDTSEKQDNDQSAESSGEWITIQWRGNPHETSESRDRTWWTKIHGSPYEHWHRKFPLPRWIDDRPRRLEFVFSDGEEFSAADSTKMWMKPTGPKYKPEEPGERDSRKRHPKIAAARDATPDWAKLKVI
ncbi:hypothetical protein [Desulfofustis limnaeus]|uniref:Tat pathway signal protein n=1 Tax=Desulfofustis limnaeus TaxID=2740163 RepID=A0ABM7W686_9BACT|nr:hypothetical protein [Desulfofustis limnaeus]MDX9895347.1 hypothetical protein [Desulfofustis sp.]BDD86451.1 hypothetical protein DPPLL_08160 [Desulfofustis limnaeus]